MVEILDLGYFIRDLIVLILMIGGTVAISLSRNTVYSYVSYKEFRRAFNLLGAAFVIVGIAQVIGVVVRTSIAFNNELLLDIRSMILLIGALLFFLSVFLTYLPLAKGDYKIIRVASERAQENIYGAYWGTKDECYLNFKSLSYKFPTIAIAREPPEVFKEKLGLKVTPVIWISKVEHENAVYPSRLPYLLERLRDFLESVELNKVILIDGIEYLILENGTEAVFKFLTSLKDFAIINRGIILVAIDRDTLDEKDFYTLTSELKHVEGLNEL